MNPVATYFLSFFFLVIGVMIGASPKKGDEK